MVVVAVVVDCWWCCVYCFGGCKGPCVCFAFCDCCGGGACCCVHVAAVLFVVGVEMLKNLTIWSCVDVASMS